MREGIFSRILRIWRARREARANKCPRCEDKGYYRVGIEKNTYNGWVFSHYEWRVCTCDQGLFFEPCQDPKFLPARKSFLAVDLT